MFIARAMYGLRYVTEATLWSSCSLLQYLKRWPAASYEAGDHC